MLQAFESSEEEGGDSGEDGMLTLLLTPFLHWSIASIGHQSAQCIGCMQP